MSEIQPIFLSKETVSDDRYLVVSLPIASGTYVEKGQTLAEFETSKSTMEIESPAAGYFFTRLQEGQELEVGGLVGLISPESSLFEDAFERFAPTDFPPAPVAATFVSSEGPRISKPAQELIARHSLDLRLFQGLELVRRQDVERLLESQATMSVPETSSAVRHPRITMGGANVIIVGGGGHAKVCIDILRQMQTFQVVGVLDAGLKVGSQVLGVPVLGSDLELSKFYDEGFRFAVNGVGAVTNHRSRREIFFRIKDAGFHLPNLIHPSAVVEPSAILGEGNQIFANATVGSAVIIGDNCIINSGVVVSHDCVLADHVHIAPGTALAGAVKVGEETLVGMGVTIYLGVSIGRRVIISNGMNIFANVPDESQLRQ